MTDWIGWAATLVCCGSYFFRNPTRLRYVQAVSAMLWMTYGFLLHAAPVIVANIFVASLALGSTRLTRRLEPAE